MEEGVEIEGNVREQERGPGVGVRGDTLQQRKRVAHPVGLMRRQGRRVDCRVNVDDFLKQCGNRPERMPQHWGQIWDHFPLLATIRMITFTHVSKL